jgi:hypothetical protein
MTVIRVTRIEGARRQLQTAIGLWFANGDSVSVLSLSANAYLVLHDLNRKAKGPSLLLDRHDITKEKRKEIARFMKFEYNFLKHSDDRKAKRSDTIEFDADIRAETFAFMAIIALLALAIPLDRHEKAFLIWSRVHHADWFGDAWRQLVGNSIPTHVMDQLRLIERPQFLDCVNQIFGENW